MERFEGFGGCSKVTENRRMKLPDDIWERDIITSETDLYWTYDSEQNVPTIMTNLPPHAFRNWDNNELYGNKRPFSSSEQTIGVPGPYFPDYKGHNNPVPTQVQIKTNEKLFIVVRELTTGGARECALKLFKLDQFARLDLSKVILTPTQRSHLVACLGRKEYTSHMEAVNDILSKLPGLFE